jgi:hypothetical protein
MTVKKSLRMKLKKKGSNWNKKNKGNKGWIEKKNIFTVHIKK